MDARINSTHHQIHQLKHAGEQQLPCVLLVRSSFKQTVEGFRTQYPFQYTPNHHSNRGLLYKTFEYLTQYDGAPPRSVECAISHCILLVRGRFVQFTSPFSYGPIWFLQLFQYVGTLKGLQQELKLLSQWVLPLRDLNVVFDVILIATAVIALRRRFKR